MNLGDWVDEIGVSEANGVCIVSGTDDGIRVKAVVNL